MARMYAPAARVVAATERREIATYRCFASAQRSVACLSAHGFPVEETAIVAEDLQPFERVAGNRGVGRALRDGAGPGAFTGAFFGLAVGLFDRSDPLTSGMAMAVYGLLFGTLVGALFGLFNHAATGGGRAPAAAGGFRAGRYTVVVDDADADRAAALLAELATGPRERRRD